MSLYGKYRPQNFANLVGQDHIRQTLLHEIQSGGLTHAYLFAGPRGTGKTSTARLIAKALNCSKKDENGEPCDACEFCTQIRDGALIDVLEIDAASNRGIDEIRDLKEKIGYAPTRAKSKTYIIDEVHMLTKEAFNALLKTLEEPPDNVYFILCTTEIHKIPETIISRCQRFDFKRIDVRTIMTRLSFIAQMEGIEAEDVAIELIARHVEGGLRDAIGLLDQLSIDNKLPADHVRSHLGITGHQTITTFLDYLEKNELQKAIHLINEVHNEGYDLTSFLREILECLRDRLIASVQNENASQQKMWLGMIERFEDARDMLRATLIPQLPLEIAAIKICGDFAGTLSIDTIAPTPASEPTVENAAVKIEETEAEMQTAQKINEGLNREQYTADGAVTEHWPRLLEHIDPPSLRRSLSQSSVRETEPFVLLLSFHSKFHMDKVNTIEHRTIIEKAAEKLFSKKVTIRCELAAKPLDTSARTAKTAKPQKTQAPTHDDIGKKAMEIFGEE